MIGLFRGHPSGSNPTLRWPIAGLTVAGAIVGALAASPIANRCHERRLTRVAGVTFTILAAVMLVSRYIL